jgi:MoaA/NifB/PqqE/SkfB family radical SAM enzyme
MVKNLNLEEIKELTLEVTDYCPAKCEFCSSSYAGLIHDITIYQLTDLVNLVKPNILNISGGEPLSCSLTPALISTLFNIKKIYVYTSGLEPLTGDLINILRFKEATLIINGNVHHPEVLMHKVKEYIGYGLKVGIHFLPEIYKYNLFCVPQHMFIEEEIQEIRYLKLIKQGSATNINGNLIDDLKRVRTKLNKIKECFAYPEKIIIGRGINGANPCHSPICDAHRKLIVRPDGNMFRCEKYKNDMSKCIGDIKELIN